MKLLIGIAHWAASLWALGTGFVLTFWAHLSTPGMADIGVALFVGGIAFNPLVLKLIPFRRYPTRLIVAFFLVVLAVVWSYFYRR